MGQPIAEYLIEPLTTIFTPPAGCNGRTYTIASGDNDTIISYSSYATTLVHGYTSSCLPDHAYEIQSPEGANIVPGYSPGLCPSGWATASAAVEPPTTTAFCYPVSWSVDPGGDNYRFNCSTIYVSPPAVMVSGDQTTSLTYATGLVQGIAVTQADSDKALLASATATSMEMAFTTATPARTINTVASATATVSATSPQSSEQANPDPGLSTGAKAGIGVGAAIGAIIFILVVGFFLWRKKRQSKTVPSQAIASNDFDKAELSGEAKQVPELKGSHLYEADGTGRPGEMGNFTARAELEGDWRGWEAPGRLN